MSRLAPLVGALLLGLAAGEGTPARSAPVEDLSISAPSGPHRFRVEVARDRTGWARGLMYREHLEPDRGMLFLYPVDRVPHIWMKNTLVPLDILFLAADGTVVSTEARLQPGSRSTVSPPRPVRATLELAGGTVERLGLGPGVRVEHPAFAGGRQGPTASPPGTPGRRPSGTGAPP